MTSEKMRHLYLRLKYNLTHFFSPESSDLSLIIVRNSIFLKDQKLDFTKWWQIVKSNISFSLFPFLNYFNQRISVPSIQSLITSLNHVVLCLSGFDILELLSHYDKVPGMQYIGNYKRYWEYGNGVLRKFDFM